MAASSRPAASSGVDYSHTPQSLVGLDLLATIPANQARNGYFVQNQDTPKVYVVFDRASGDTESVLVLNGAVATGDAGGYCDMQSLPHSGRIRVMGTDGSQVAARDW